MSDTPETDSPPRLVRPYFLLAGVAEVPLSHYQGMKVGLPPICICCRRTTDGPASGCAKALCFECYELVRTRGSSLRTNNVTPKTMSDTPETQCGTTHYAGCACHEKDWKNKWQCAVELAAQAEAKLDALVAHHTRSIIAHAKEVDALKAELASKTPQP